MPVVPDDHDGFRDATDGERRTALRAQADRDGRPPGVLALRAGDPVGWCAVAPRTAYSRLLGGRKLRTAGVADDLPDVRI